jgi:hypothetical protein
MSRVRALVSITLLAVAGLLVPATAASAAAPLQASITCDPVTGAITTSASGNLFAPGRPRPVVVQFQRRGVNLTPTGLTSVPALAPPFKVTEMSWITGDVAATGYTATFDPATSLYYRENLTVTFMDIGGFVYTTREASCQRDVRTTVTLTCDPAAHTVTATVAGHDGNAGASNGAGRVNRVGYRTITTSQATANEPRFRGGLLGDGWDMQHSLVRAADGTWADQGYVHTISSNPYYYAEELTVGVFDTFGTLVGGGFAKCTLVDGSATTPTT